MKTNWPIKTIGQLCDFQNGYAFKSSLFKNSGSPILRISNIQNEKIDTTDLVFFDKNDYKIDLSKFEIKKGDILIAMSGGTTGKLGIFDKNEVMYQNQRVGRFIPGENLIKEYLYFFLTTQIENNLRISLGSAQPNLSTEQINNIQIPVPSLVEQKRIVDKLNYIVNKIHKDKEIAVKNLQNARELFDNYLYGVFSENKIGWETKKLKDVAEYFNGLTYSPKNVSDKGIIVLRSSNIQNDQLDFSDIVRVNSKVNDRLKVRKGDILMCSRNGSKKLIGKTAKIDDSNEEMTFGTFMMVIRSEHNPYLYWFFKSSDFRRQMNVGENTMINQITRYMLDEVKLSFPNYEKQAEIVKDLNILNENFKKLEKQYNQKLILLAELKKSLLHKAFQGELHA